MKKSVKVLLNEAKKAVIEDLGRDAIYAPAAKAYRLALHNNPWLAWELTLQFNLGKKKYNHVMELLFMKGELGMDIIRDDLTLLMHRLNIIHHERQIGCICLRCFKRMKHDEFAHERCCLDCFFKEEVGHITVPIHLAPMCQTTVYSNP